MSVNERRRQLKLAKKNKRSNEIAKQRNRANNRSMAQLALEASNAPWDCCLAWESGGMTSICAVRKTRSGRTGAMLLVDMFCLGVKDCFLIQDVTSQKLADMLEQGYVSVAPAKALKLTLGAIDFARSVGFEPHPDAPACLNIFRGVDPNDCDESFEYGEDGKPFYVSGPHDGPEKQRRIMATLSQTGAGNHHFLIRVDESELPLLGEMHDEADETDDSRSG
jgi:hypothetical protein